MTNQETNAGAILVSENNGIGCTKVRMATREEEMSMRNSEEVERNIMLYRKYGDRKYKERLPYRVVNGVPNGGQEECWRNSFNLEPSGMLLLDFDLKDGKENSWENVYKIMRPMVLEWGVLHVEKSISGGAHVVVRMAEGVTRKEMTELFERRTGCKLDYSCCALSQPCFLVPESYILYVDEHYYDPKPLQPLTLSEADMEIMEEIRSEEKKAVEEKRAKISGSIGQVELSGTQDDYELVERICDKIDEIKLDITEDYHDWTELCFSLCTAFGERGRTFFHRLSQHYYAYKDEETDRKYSNQLQCNRGEVTIRTLVWMMQQVGVM